MFKIKNFKVEFNHLLTAVSAIGMLVSFIVSLCSEKKTVSAITFFISFAGLVASICMEAGVLPTPPIGKKLEIEIEGEEEEEEGAEDSCECMVDEEE